MGRWSLLFALAVGLAAPAAVQAGHKHKESAGGVCLEALKITGERLQKRQNEYSVRVLEKSSISTKNRADYVRIKSDERRGQYEFYFSPPSLLLDGAAKALSVEFSALIADGHGRDWDVQLYDRSTDKWTDIGDLSSAGKDWTMFALEVKGKQHTPLTKYLDSDKNGNEVLIRVITRKSRQEAYIDFLKIKA